MCGKVWETFNEFLSDPDIKVNGYQAFLREPEKGLILFTHDREDCGTTVSFEPGRLIKYYDIPRYPESQFGTEACEGHCLVQTDLEACSQNCSMRWVRDLIQLLRNKQLPALQ